MSVYFTSFYPICCTKAGRTAVNIYKLPPYIDGSCRREPDFQNPYPCITGLCRPGFSKKLQKGDLVIYITNKKDIAETKLVAILEVVDRIVGHDNAALWYDKRGIHLPNDLMVDQNNPYPLDQTHRMGGWDAWIKGTESLTDWNNGYQERANKSPEVSICRIWKNQLYLDTPIPLTDAALEAVFGRKTLTRTPPRLNTEQWVKFLSAIGLETIK